MSAPPLLLRYPRSVQMGEYGRAGAGLAFCASPLLILRPPVWMAAIFALGAALFLAYLLKTAARQMGRIELSDDGIQITGPLAASLRWQAMRSLSLRYYPSNRERTAGWMRLILQGDRGRPLSFDSELTGFADLLNRALRAGIANDVPLSDTTVANLAAAGHRVPDDTAIRSGTRVARTIAA